MRNLNFIKKAWFFVAFFIIGVLAVHIIQIAYAESEENEKLLMKLYLLLRTMWMKNQSTG